MTTTHANTIDIREIAAGERHALVFERFDALLPGQSLQVTNDHDPQGLRQQFETRALGQFEWTALQAGPQLWRVQITRRTAKVAAVIGDSCCSGGACCG